MANLARIRGDRIEPAVRGLCGELRRHGHEAYIVGGAIRDLLRGVAPTDWDLATDARPEEVMRIFPHGLPTGVKYGTVTVPAGDLRVEVTTFRGEGAYRDGRRPETVVFGVSIREDLARRDFTINAMAYDPLAGALVDPFRGRRDLALGIIRTVGDPAARFQEDALRMLRFYRFVAVLGFRPARDAVRAMQPALLERVSPERIRDELAKMLLAQWPIAGLDGLVASGLMEMIVPELVSAPDEEKRWLLPKLQRHAFLAVEAIESRLHLRLAALLHDIAKPASYAENGGKVHFYGHDEAGARLAAEILGRLRFPRDLIETVATLVRLHMFQLPAAAGGAAIRRLMRKAGGPEMLRDLLELRRADIIATGNHYWRAAAAWNSLREAVAAALAEGAVFSPRDLAIDGRDVMRILGIGPGPEVGRILDALMDRVIEDPACNERDKLEELVRGMKRETGEGHNIDIQD